MSKHTLTRQRSPRQRSRVVGFAGALICGTAALVAVIGAGPVPGVATAMYPSRLTGHLTRLSTPNSAQDPTTSDSMSATNSTDLTMGAVPSPTGPWTGRAGSRASAASRGQARTTATKPPVATTTTAAAKPAAQPNTSTAESQVAVLTNAQRKTAGCANLTVNAALAKAARAHSLDMATRGYFSHTSPDGTLFSDRITTAGYRWSLAAENIASGQATPAEVTTAWMNSPGHRANIVNCGLREIGVGLAANASGTLYWTQEFGTA